MAVLIVIRGVHWATRQLDSSLLPTRQRILQAQAVRYGFDVAGQRKAMAAVPAFERERGELEMRFLAQRAEILYKKGLAKKKRAEVNGELEFGVKGRTDHLLEGSQERLNAPLDRSRHTR